MLSKSCAVALGLILWTQYGCNNDLVDEYRRGEAVLMGTVRTVVGDGVLDATVEVDAFLSTVHSYSGSTTTDSSGAYSLFMIMPSSPGGPARVAVTVTPPAGSSLQGATAEIEPVEFWPEGSPVRDTAWVNVVLEPLPQQTHTLR